MRRTHPIPHIAGNFTHAAMNVSKRVKGRRRHNMLYLWLADDQCIYLQRRSHSDAPAIEGYSSKQTVNRGRDEPAARRCDIEANLRLARFDSPQKAPAEAVAV